MGVKELWGLVSPTGELLPLTALEGQTIAVDLSCWVVDSQTLHVRNVVRPHLRNLFFRTLALLYAGVLPVFVVEGDAPSLKWNTISSRNHRNFHHPAPVKNLSIKTGKRSRFKSVLKECCELLDHLGVPWIQASGEAEATCAALSYHQMVTGVITQDSDIFLYGGQTVFRNFTANQQKATVEKFSMDILEDRLQLTRGGLIFLAILLGCDYLPGGVQGVGRDTAVRLLRAWYKTGERDPVQRMCSWASQPNTSTRVSKLSSTKWKNGNDDELEAGVKERVQATDGFPFKDVIQEFQRKLSCPAKKIFWAQPFYEELVKWCIDKLDWEPMYALEKISPVVARWSVTQGTMLRCLKPVSIMKRCVRRGIAACVVQWRVISNDLPHQTQEYLTTDEPLHLIRKSLPQLLHNFEEKACALKKGKQKSRKIKDDTKSLDKETNRKLLKEDSRNLENEYSNRMSKDDPKNFVKNGHRKIDKNDSKKLDESIIKVTASENINCKGEKDRFIFKSYQYGRHQRNIIDELNFDGDHHNSKVMNIDLSEEEEEGMSLIIDRILNINMNSQSFENDSMNKPAFDCRNVEQKILQVSTFGLRSVAQSNGLHSKCGSREDKVNVGNTDREKFFDVESKDEVDKDKENQPEGLFERVSKRIAGRGKKKEKSSFTPLKQPELSCMLNNESFSSLRIICPVRKNGNISHTAGESLRNSTAIKGDFEASGCFYNQSKFSDSFRVLMEQETLHENNKAFKSNVYHGAQVSFVQDSHGPKADANVSCGQVSKDLFDDTDENVSVGTPQHSLLPKLHSTPCVSSTKTIVRENSLDISVRSVLSSPDTCVVEMYPGKQIFSPSGEDMHSNFSKSLHIRCLPHSTHPSSKMSKMPLDDSALGLYSLTAPEEDSTNLHKLDLQKEKKSGLPVDSCSKSMFCSTQTISEKKNLDDVCFRLTDSFFDCKSSLLYEHDTLEPSVCKVTPRKGGLQQPSVIKKTHGEYIKEKDIAHGEGSGDKLPVVCTQTDSNKLRKHDKSDETSLSLRLDDKSVTCDPFSPLGVGLTLAERLKVKFPAKTFAKLLDELTYK